jgi:hypothetical protein
LVDFFCDVMVLGSFSFEVIAWDYVSCSFEQNPVLVFGLFCYVKVVFFLVLVRSLFQVRVFFQCVLWFCIFSLNYVPVSVLTDEYFLVFV